MDRLIKENEVIIRLEDDLIMYVDETNISTDFIGTKVFYNEKDLIRLDDNYAILHKDCIQGGRLINIKGDK